MYEIRETLYGEQYLRWVDRRRTERGLWVMVGHSNEPGIETFVGLNREMGLTVLIDEDGYYRALVLKD